MTTNETFELDKLCETIEEAITNSISEADADIIFDVALYFLAHDNPELVRLAELLGREDELNGTE